MDRSFTLKSMTRVRCFAFIIIALLSSTCRQDGATLGSRENPPSVEISPSPSASESNQVETSKKRIDLAFATSGTITEGPFTARIRRHEVKLDGVSTDLSYATLERNGRVLITFDSVRSPIGNETRIAFSLSICPRPVVFVEQESHRWWRTWVVALGKLECRF